ncbi:MAG: hypothetical protein COY74_08395 [Nitrosopumilales archaeon CG_4_10_14_0_8_um_filter_34_8]|nr:MAG: hypothetical protein COY74_08395 [Nitrosopumilales archaeon CG_4_10_14_0_8_um_filter_34_8]PJB99179.1 MAG: hypothetical protein CO079_00165 [Nitrosopumilales archaeon CG_4_9_14_0_8_um_filter_34_10]
MVDEKLFGQIAEEIVLQILKKEGKKVIDNRKNPRKFGDFQIGNKIIEVKGHNEDHTGEKYDKFDYVARYITLSVKEWKFLNEFPNQFDVYIVYRLNEEFYPNHSEWNFPKIIRIKGTELIGRDTRQPTIQVKTLKSFWSDKGKRQIPVPKTIWDKVKKKYKK